LGTISLTFAMMAGCAEKRAPERKVLVGGNRESDAVITGVLPEAFQCESVAPADELKAIIGKHRPIDSAFDTPAGLPAPCNYLAASGDDAGGQQWSFDLDCRANALDDGNALMVQYSSGADAKAVHVGSSGLDYKDSALLFIDDDAPCYGRVLGPTADGRKQLAQLVSVRLNERTAPTSLRYRRAQNAPE